MDTLATASLAQTLAEGTNASPEALSILDLATKGGWIMIVLLLLSLLAVYIFVTKYLQMRSAGQEDKYFVQRIKDYVTEGKTSSAIKLCEETNTPYARMIHKGLSRIGRPMADVLVIVENVGNNGIYEALVTTVGGLVVGIIALFAYNYLVAELDKVVGKMEAKTVEFMDLLNEVGH